ncbi:MAG: hypothetical protein JSV37_03855 [Anaerolineaceae bacterium]|nr:MAG: hypothetical protein JSV37_03855 [Anaerolineaceae bacterium]
MTKDATTEKISPTREDKFQAYSPSWINRLTAWVSRLPGTSWMYYLGLGVVLFLIPSIVNWSEGVLPSGSFLPVQGFMPGVIGFFLAMFHYLDKRAGVSLAAMRPALKVSEGEYQELNYRLTNLPAGMTLIASLITLAIILFTEFVDDPYHIEVLNISPVSTNLFRLIYFFGWWVLGAYLYHAIHQLRLINRIYTQHTRVNLFRMKPLYAFSNLSALTAGSIAMVLYGWMAVAPGVSLADPIAFILTFIVLLIAVVIFIWPQLGIHNLQVAEKDRLLEEANQRFEAIIGELHRRVDAGELDQMNDLRVTMTNLEMELNALKGIHTWPWQSETVRWLITALVLPLGLWLIQSVFQRVLAP